jgi:hypothetical protein
MKSIVLGATLLAPLAMGFKVHEEVTHNALMVSAPIDCLR